MSIEKGKLADAVHRTVRKEGILIRRRNKLSADLIPTAARLLMEKDALRRKASKQATRKSTKIEQHIKKKDNVKAKVRQEMFFNFMMFGKFGSIGSKVIFNLAAIYRFSYKP